MDLTQLTAVLAAAPATQPNPTADLMRMVGTIVIFGIIFYVALIRPQQKKAKEHTQLLKTVRGGDKILTNGGMLATVVNVKEKSLTIRSGDSKLEITKSALAEIVERSGQSSES